MNKWSKDELMLVMNLYTKLRYGQFNYKNIEVIKLATLIGKTPGAVAFKLVHISRQDPKHKDRVKGLANSGRNVVEVYNEFTENWEEMLYQSEILLAKYQNAEIQEVTLSHSEAKELERDILIGKEGKDVQRIVKSRVNQALFRKVVINNYAGACTICGLSIKELLVASHILKWSESEIHRLNPENGLCLCSIHDKAFELGYIGIDSDYSILISEAVQSIKDKETYISFFGRHQHKSIKLPDKFYPSKVLLKSHLEQVFKR